MKYAMVIMLLFLAGCNTTRTEPTYVPIIKTVVADVPQPLLESCPSVPKPPAHENLTNQDIADYIQSLYDALNRCNISMRKIKQHIEETKKLYGVV